MADARNVYLLLFVLLTIPTVYYSLKKRRQVPDKTKKALLLVLMGSLTIVWAVFGIVFYNYTINRQVLLVAERGATTLYQAGTSNGDLEQSLSKQGIGGAATVDGNKAGPWSSFRGADILIPEKTLTIDNVKYYPVVLQKANGERLLIAFDIQEGAPKSMILHVKIYWPEEIGTLLNRITYFKAGTI